MAGGSDEAWPRAAELHSARGDEEPEGIDPLSEDSGARTLSRDQPDPEGAGTGQHQTGIRGHKRPWGVGTRDAEGADRRGNRRGQVGGAGEGQAHSQEGRADTSPDGPPEGASAVDPEGTPRPRGLSRRSDRPSEPED